MTFRKYLIRLALFLAISNSFVLFAQQQNPISEIRAAISHAVDPRLYLNNRLKRFTVQKKEAYPYAALHGNFFVLQGSVAEQEAQIAYIVKLEATESEYWPEALLLSCLDALAATPQKKSAVFSVIPADANILDTIDELREFGSISMIVLLEDLPSTSGIGVKRASEKGEAPLDCLRSLQSNLGAGKLPWKDSPIAPFLLRYGFVPDTGMLSAFHEARLPAISVLVNLNDLKDAFNESALVSALTKLSIDADLPSVKEYNYLNFNVRNVSMSISEKWLVVILMSCWLLIILMLVAAPLLNNARYKETADREQVTKHLPSILQGLVFLVITFIVVFFFSFSSNKDFLTTMHLGDPSVIFMLSAAFFSLITLASFTLYFSALKYAKLDFDCGHTIVLLFLFDTALACYVFIPFAPFFGLCALAFLATKRNLWLSALSAAPICLLVFLVLLFANRNLTPAFLNEQNKFSIVKSLLPTFFLSPFFLWISYFGSRSLSLANKKKLVISACASLSLIILIVLIKLFGRIA